jgi:L-iditol 2-dehydrogenase
MRKGVSRSGSPLASGSSGYPEISMPALMKAVRLLDVGKVVVDEVAVPDPAADEVLVKMRRASICGSDVHVVYDGFLPDEMPGRPGYPGHEGVGEVVESRSPDFRQGEPVLTVPIPTEAGCFAEYQVVAAGSLVKLPAGFEPERLLMAQQLGTTIYATRRFWPGEPGHVAAVIGAGSAGLFFLQLLRRRGFEKLVVADLEPARLEIAKELGADVTVQAPREDVVEACLDLTQGQGADLVVEAAGYDACRAQAIDAVRERGRLGFFGFPERRERSPFPMWEAFRRAPTIEFTSGTQREPGLRSFREAVDLIANGEIEVGYLLAPTFPIDRASEALDQARDRGRGAVKINLDLTA